MIWNSTALSMEFVYKRVDKNWNEQEIVADISSCSISRKYLSSLKEGASFDYVSASLDGADKISILDLGITDYLRLYLNASDGQDTESVALGTFMISTPSSSFDDMTESGTATGYSVLQVLQDEGLSSTYTIPAGTNLIAHAASLITSKGLNCAAEPSNKVSAADASFTTDSTYLDIVQWCCESCNYESPSIDGYGTVRLNKYVEPTNTSVGKNYDSTSTVMFPSVEHELDLFSLANKVIVVQSTSDDVLIGTYENNNQADPYSTHNRRTVTATYQKDGFETQAEINDYAKRLFIEQSSVESVVFETRYDNQQLGELVSFSYGGKDIRGLKVVEQDITCDIDCVVKNRARRFV